jgi:hypothetical protein
MKTADTTLKYDLGSATNLAVERPTITDLQRAQVHALRGGDRRRAAAYALVVQRRVAAAQKLAA